MACIREGDSSRLAWAAQCFVFRDVSRAPEVLLLERIQDGHLLFIPGGKAEVYDRHPLYTCRRELFEEADVLIPYGDLHWVGASVQPHDGVPFQLVDFATEVPQDVAFTNKEPHKHAHMRWVAVGTLHEPSRAVSLFCSDFLSRMDAALSVVRRARLYSPCPECDAQCRIHTTCRCWNEPVELPSGAPEQARRWAGRTVKPHLVTPRSQYCFFFRARLLRLVAALRRASAAAALRRESAAVDPGAAAASEPFEVRLILLHSRDDCIGRVWLLPTGDGLEALPGGVLSGPPPSVDVGPTVEALICPFTACADLAQLRAVVSGFVGQSPGGMSSIPAVAAGTPTAMGDVAPSSFPRTMLWAVRCSDVVASLLRLVPGGSWISSGALLSSAPVDDRSGAAALEACMLLAPPCDTLFGAPPAGDTRRGRSLGRRPARQGGSSAPTPAAPPPAPAVASDAAAAPSVPAPPAPEAPAVPPRGRGRGGGRGRREGGEDPGGRARDDDVTSPPPPCTSQQRSNGRGSSALDQANQRLATLLGPNTRCNTPSNKGGSSESEDGSEDEKDFPVAFLECRHGAVPILKNPSEAGYPGHRLCLRKECIKEAQEFRKLHLAATHPCDSPYFRNAADKGDGEQAYLLCRPSAHTEACIKCELIFPGATACCDGDWLCNVVYGDRPSCLYTAVAGRKHCTVKLSEDSPVGAATLTGAGGGDLSEFCLLATIGKGDTPKYTVTRNADADTHSVGEYDRLPLLLGDRVLPALFTTPSATALLAASPPDEGEESDEDGWDGDSSCPRANSRRYQGSLVDADAFLAARYEYASFSHYSDAMERMVARAARDDRDAKQRLRVHDVDVLWRVGFKKQRVAHMHLTAAQMGMIGAGDGATLTVEHPRRGWAGTGKARIQYNVPFRDGSKKAVTTVSIQNDAGTFPAGIKSGFVVGQTWQPITFGRNQTALRMIRELGDAACSWIIARCLVEGTRRLQELVTSRVSFKRIDSVGSFGGPPLNPSQIEAITLAASLAFSIVRGPPGTGKTRTAACVAAYFARAYPKVGTLACTPSNTAADELCDEILKADPNLRILRFASASNDRTMDVVPSAQLAIQVRELSGDGELMGLQSLLDKGHELSQEDADRYQELRSEAELTCVRLAQVVVCTCAAAGDPRLIGVSFPNVVLDEVGQGVEPDIVIPIAHGAENVSLFGDDKQLGPVVSNPASPLATSMLERLIALGSPVHQLDIQYRMHPSISGFSSKQFYGGTLKDDASVLGRPHTSLTFPWPSGSEGSSPNCHFFWAVSGAETQGSRGTSYANAMESAKVVQVVAALLRGGAPASAVGVVTPYNAQRDLVKQGLLAAGVKDGIDVRVASVDAFQGGARDYIVITTVRTSNKLGFVRDPRRLNVALTRARLGLVVVGHPTALATSFVWRAYLEHMAARQATFTGELGSLAFATLAAVLASAPSHLLRTMPPEMEQLVAAPAVTAETVAAAREPSHTDQLYAQLAHLRELCSTLSIIERGMVTFCSPDAACTLAEGSRLAGASAVHVVQLANPSAKVGSRVEWFRAQNSLQPRSPQTALASADDPLDPAVRTAVMEAQAPGSHVLTSLGVATDLATALRYLEVAVSFSTPWALLVGPLFDGAGREKLCQDATSRDFGTMLLPGDAFGIPTSSSWTLFSSTTVVLSLERAMQELVATGREWWNSSSEPDYFTTSMGGAELPLGKSASTLRVEKQLLSRVTVPAAVPSTMVRWLVGMFSVERLTALGLPYMSCSECGRCPGLAEWRESCLAQAVSTNLVPRISEARVVLLLDGTPAVVAFGPSLPCVTLSDGFDGVSLGEKVASSLKALLPSLGLVESSEPLCISFVRDLLPLSPSLLFYARLGPDASRAVRSRLSSGRSVSRGGGNPGGGGQATSRKGKQKARNDESLSSADPRVLDLRRPTYETHGLEYHLDVQDIACLRAAFQRYEESEAEAALPANSLSLPSTVVYRAVDLKATVHTLRSSHPSRAAALSRSEATSGTTVDFTHVRLPEGSRVLVVEAPEDTEATVAYIFHANLSTPLERAEQYLEDRKQLVERKQLKALKTKDAPDKLVFTEEDVVSVAYRRARQKPVRYRHTVSLAILDERMRRVYFRFPEVGAPALFDQPVPTLAGPAMKEHLEWKGAIPPLPNKFEGIEGRLYENGFGSALSALIRAVAPQMGGSLAEEVLRPLLVKAVTLKPAEFTRHFIASEWSGRLDGSLGRVDVQYYLWYVRLPTAPAKFFNPSTLPRLHGLEEVSGFKLSLRAATVCDLPAPSNPVTQCRTLEPKATGTLNRAVVVTSGSDFPEEITDRLVYFTGIEPFLAQIEENGLRFSAAALGAITGMRGGASDSALIAEAFLGVVGSGQESVEVAPDAICRKFAAEAAAGAGQAADTIGLRHCKDGKLSKEERRKKDKETALELVRSLVVTLAARARARIHSAALEPKVDSSDRTWALYTEMGDHGDDILRGLKTFESRLNKGMHALVGTRDILVFQKAVGRPLVLKEVGAKMIESRYSKGYASSFESGGSRRNVLLPRKPDLSPAEVELEFLRLHATPFSSDPKKWLRHFTTGSPDRVLLWKLNNVERCLRVPPKTRRLCGPWVRHETVLVSSSNCHFRVADYDTTRTAASADRSALSPIEKAFQTVASPHLSRTNDKGVAEAAASVFQELVKEGVVAESRPKEIVYEIQPRGVLDASVLDVACYVVHQTNCTTTHAAGLAAEIGKVLPYAQPYVEREHTGPSEPGSLKLRQPPLQGRAAGGPTVVELNAQYYGGAPTDKALPGLPGTVDDARQRLRWFREGLDKLGLALAGAPHPTIVAFPWKIGCGLAAGNWEQHLAAIEQFASANSNLEVRVVQRTSDSARELFANSDDLRAQIRAASAHATAVANRSENKPFRQLAYSLIEALETQLLDPDGSLRTSQTGK